MLTLFHLGTTERERQRGKNTVREGPREEREDGREMMVDREIDMQRNICRQQVASREESKPGIMSHACHPRILEARG